MIDLSNPKHFDTAVIVVTIGMTVTAYIVMGIMTRYLIIPLLKRFAKLVYFRLIIPLSVGRDHVRVSTVELTTLDLTTLDILGLFKNFRPSARSVFFGLIFHNYLTEAFLLYIVASVYHFNL